MFQRLSFGSIRLLSSEGENSKKMDEAEKEDLSILGLRIPKLEINETMSLIQGGNPHVALQEGPDDPSSFITNIDDPQLKKDSENSEVGYIVEEGDRWFHPIREDSALSKTYREYYDDLKRASLGETDLYDYLEQAFSRVPSLGKRPLINLWNATTKVIQSSKDKDMPEIAQQLAIYMSTDPGKVGPFLACYHRCSPRMNDVQNQMENLAVQLTELSTAVAANQFAVQSTVNEIQQARSQMKRFYKYMAKTKEVLESVLSKIKQDISSREFIDDDCPFSLPSGGTTPRGIALKSISPTFSGEINEIYHAKLRRGRIVSMIPPRGAQYLTGMIWITDTDHVAFLNLSQADIINRLRLKVELRRLFCDIPKSEKRQLLLALTDGLRPSEYQWYTLDQSDSASD